MSFMKRNALILGAGSALLTASVAAHAQESGHLSADYLKQATRLIHWPQGLEPPQCRCLRSQSGLDRRSAGDCLGKPD